MNKVKKNLKSWKTSLFGGVAAAAGAVAAFPDMGDEIQKYAALVMAVSGALFAFYSRDGDKSSEDVGAK
jgi:hypothetical protein